MAGKTFLVDNDILTLDNVRTSRRFLKSIAVQPLFTRDGAVVGYTALPKPKHIHSCELDRFFENASVHNLIFFYLETLQKIKSDCESHIRILGGPKKAVRSSHYYFISIEKDCLCNAHLLQHIMETAQSISLFGFKAVIVIPDRPLRLKYNIKKLYAALYALSDAGLMFALERIDFQNDIDLNEFFPHNLVKFIFTTPENIGIGAAEEDFNHSEYMQGTTRVIDVLNERNIRLIATSIVNDWQDSLIRALPIHFMQGTHYGASEEL